MKTEGKQSSYTPDIIGETLRKRVNLTNILAWVFLVLSLPNIFTYYKQSSPMLITTLINIAAFILVLILNKTGQNKSGRFLMANSMNVLASINHAYFLHVGEPPSAIFYLIQLALMIMNFALFTYHEFRLLLISIFINSLLILSVPLLNPLFEADVDRSQLDIPALYALSVMIGIAVCIVPLLVSFRQTRTLIDDLQSKNKKLLENTEKEQKQALLTKNLLDFSSILRGEIGSFQDTCDRFIYKLCMKYQGGIAALFTYNENLNMMQLQSHFAFGEIQQHRSPQNEQGLLMECFRNKKMIRFRPENPDYFSLRYGMGHVTPSEIFIFPLMYNQEVIAVLEFGPVETPDGEEMEFLYNVLEDLAVAIKVNQNRAIA